MTIFARGRLLSSARPSVGSDPMSYLDLGLSPGTVRYVTPSPTTPVQSIIDAINTMSAGDVLKVTPGTYTAERALDIPKSGTSGNWITVMGDGGKVRLNYTQNGIYAISGISRAYIQLEGFEAVHTNPTTAQQQWSAGIFVGNGAGETAPTAGHHYRIVNCVAIGWPTGIQCFNTDQWLVAGCVTNDCGWYHEYGGSGISCNLSSEFIATDPIYSFGGTDYRGAVIGCQAYNCHTRRQAGGWFSDGNGIIISDNQLESAGGGYRGHNGPFLAAHNVCVFNGGRGIQGYDVRQLHVVNNTLAYNGQHEVSAAGYGATSWSAGHDIGMNRCDWGGADGTSAYAGTQSVVANNLIIHESITGAWVRTTTIESIYSNVIGANNYHVNPDVTHTAGDDGHLNLTGDINTTSVPALTAVSTVYATADYRPTAGSAVIDAGSATYDASALDLAGNTIGVTPDCGAYEYVAP